MAYNETFLCDSCGYAKRETNNWFIVESEINNDGDLSYSTYKFYDSYARNHKDDKCIKHACGIECAAKLEACLKAKMQSGGKVEKPVENDLLVPDQKETCAVEVSFDAML